MGRDDEPERAPHAPDLLDRDGVGEGVHPGAALVLGDRDAEPAHLAEPADDLDREAALPLVLLDDRRDLLRHEVADRRREAARAPARGRGPRPSGLLALDDLARRRRATGGRHVGHVRHERGRQRRRGGLLLLLDRQDAEPAELGSSSRM